ncbi:SET domain-containing protein [Exidia glandulosa HHB12029]|uniref:SET domain-containing protein n=1 Tax=Exidia glandulosa HHB12029 TaxID=1314781 RepID=A0A166MSE7_EXIGL|nr:SET domain-containing protein [Exidia glandulosa HHB12029]
MSCWNRLKFASRPQLAELSSPERCSTQRCSKCAVAYYCSTACQNADWPMHKPECVSLRDWAKSAPDAGVAISGEAIRCLGRVLRLREREGHASKWTKQMSSMQSLRQNLPSSAAESHTHIAHALVRYMSISGPEGLHKCGITSAGDLVDIISQFTTNSFTLSSSSLSPIGVCISPTVALANHSCDPNAVVVFPRPSGTTLQEPVMQIIAIKNISPGEEILTSYVDTSQPGHLRRQDLRETYGFTCACDLCEGRPTMPTLTRAIASGVRRSVAGSVAFQSLMTNNSSASDATRNTRPLRRKKCWIVFDSRLRRWRRLRSLNCLIPPERSE